MITQKTETEKALYETRVALSTILRIIKRHKQHGLVLKPNEDQYVTGAEHILKKHFNVADILR